MPQSALLSRKFLLVGDDSDDLDLLAEALKENGIKHEFVVVRNGKETIE
ncbi:hypothetical protein SAMN05444008_12058 [Cnuella takakiae]|uniref:Response regulatory domain-containing protein n=1 Tax=Cnuella takakiae TaxID=1302690 RepID=A0A1M5HTY5_9BACT|nr:hypothetical protein SAMN05444008_12058 [Cnuella takakiae]